MVNFYDLDANGYRTRAADGALAYGNGSNYSSASNSGIIEYLGGIDPVSNAPVGLGVIGTNLERNLPNDPTLPSRDAAAVGQVGKVSIGDIDISDDGRFLFVMNLYSRKLLRLELNNPANPTAVVAVTEYTLPTVTTTNGELRPWAIGYHKGKVYVGAVASAENDAPRIKSNPNLHAYVFELNNANASASFSPTPVLDYPLDFKKGATGHVFATDDTRFYYGWTDNPVNFYSVGNYTNYPTPIFSDIEFNERGDMINSYLDRSSLQAGSLNYKYPEGFPAGNTSNGYAQSNADIFIAGKNEGCNNGYDFEFDKTITSDGIDYIGTGHVLSYGPGGKGTFFYQQHANHLGTSLGAMAVLPGSAQVVETRLDPVLDWSGGTMFVSSKNGDDTGGFTLYNNLNGGFGKGNGMGDVELLMPIAPIEIGNYVWHDVDLDGIQDPGEPPLVGVMVQLLNESGTVLATTTTDNFGQYYFSSTITSTLVASSRYTVRVSDLGTHASVTGLLLTDLVPLTPGETASENSGGTLHNNDGVIEGGYPSIHLTTGDWGHNNHTYDFGFAVACRDPEGTLSIIQPTCTGGGGIIISDFDAGSRYRISQGSTFNPNQATVMAVIPADGVLISSLPNASSTYTVRVYDTTFNTCFKDISISVTATTPCCHSGDCGSATIQKNTKP